MLAHFLSSHFKQSKLHCIIKYQYLNLHYYLFVAIKTNYFMAVAVIATIVATTIIKTTVATTVMAAILTITILGTIMANSVVAAIITIDSTPLFPIVSSSNLKQVQIFALVYRFSNKHYLVSHLNYYMSSPRKTLFRLFQSQQLHLISFIREILRFLFILPNCLCI